MTPDRKLNGFTGSVTTAAAMAVLCLFISGSAMAQSGPETDRCRIETATGEIIWLDRRCPEREAQGLGGQDEAGAEDGGGDEGQAGDDGGQQGGGGDEGQAGDDGGQQGGALGNPGNAKDVGKAGETPPSKDDALTGQAAEESEWGPIPPGVRGKSDSKSKGKGSASAQGGGSSNGGGPGSGNGGGNGNSNGNGGGNGNGNGGGAGNGN